MRASQGLPSRVPLRVWGVRLFGLRTFIGMPLKALEGNYDIRVWVWSIRVSGLGALLGGYTVFTRCL